MGQNKKITDEQLKKELKNGKTYKQVCHEYGYGYPSRKLEQRMRNLGYRKNSNTSVDNYNGMKPYVPSSKLEKAVKINKGVGKDQDSYNYFWKVTSEGNLELVLTEYEWRSEK